MLLKSAFAPQAIFWRNLVGAYSIGLDRFAPVSVVACSDHGKEVDPIQGETGIRFYTLEEITHTRSAPVGQPKESDEEQGLIRVLSRLPKDRYAIACPVPSRMLDEFVRETGFRSASTPYKIASWLAEKENWFQLFDEIGLPRLSGRWIRLGEMRFAELADTVGPVFVAQLSRGLSGSGTAVIRSEREYEHAGARFGDALAWVAPYMTGPSLVTHGVVLEHGTIVGYPSVQLVGFDECHARPGVFCGNDFYATRRVPSALITQLQEQTERMGRGMASLGFRGIFGVDFVTDPEMRNAYAVDLNPRWLGSTALLSQAEEVAGRTPLAALDLATRLGAVSEEEGLALGARCREPVEGCQMILFPNGREWVEVMDSPRPGIYSRENGAVQFVREGIRLGDCRGEAEFLVTAGIPRPGLRLQRGSQMLRIYSRAPVLEPGGPRLLPWCRQAIEEMYALTPLAPISEPD
jgi:hypothetical protein